MFGHSICIDACRRACVFLTFDHFISSRLPQHSLLTAFILFSVPRLHRLSDSTTVICSIDLLQHPAIRPSHHPLHQVKHLPRILISPLLHEPKWRQTSVFASTVRPMRISKSHGHPSLPISRTHHITSSTLTEICRGLICVPQYV